MLMSFGRKRRPSLFTVDGQLASPLHVGIICDADGNLKSVARERGDIPDLERISPKPQPSWFEETSYMKARFGQIISPKRYCAILDHEMHETSQSVSYRIEKALASGLFAEMDNDPDAWS